MSDEHNDFGSADESDYADLHKLTEQSGDGFIPDMYQIVGEREQRSRTLRDRANIVTFPRFRTRAPGEDAPFDIGKDISDGGNVVKFR